MNIKDTLNNWLPTLLKEVELGNPDAMGLLGYMYQQGIGVEQDEAKAQEYFEMERNAPPFDLADDDTSSNPWMQKNAVEV